MSAVQQYFRARRERDEHFLRRSFDVARRAITHGNHPFGAILVDQPATS